LSLRKKQRRSRTIGQPEPPSVSASTNAVTPDDPAEAENGQKKYKNNLALLLPQIAGDDPETVASVGKEMRGSQKGTSNQLYPLPPSLLLVLRLAPINLSNSPLVDATLPAVDSN